MWKTPTCPAKDKSCLSCKKVGHIQAFCRDRKGRKITEIKEPVVAEPTGSLGLLSPGLESGHFFSLDGGVQVGSLHPKAFLTNKTWGGSQEAPPQQYPDDLCLKGFSSSFTRPHQDLS